MTIASSDLLLLNFLVEEKKPGAVPVDALLGRALRALRAYLSVDIALITEVVNGSAIIRHADCGPDDARLRIGAPDPFEHASCGSGGNHLCVPIELDGGVVYGSLICAGPKGEAVLNQRDLSMIRVFAELAAEHIEAELHAASRDRGLIAKIQQVIVGNGLSFLYQPVYDVGRGNVAGFEALARFAGTPPRSPDLWFADAARVGLDVELSARLIETAIQSFERLPESVYIGFNVSPNIIVNGQLERAFADAPLDRIVLEINEHLSIRQYDEMAKVLKPMREQGLRISVDDEGGGVESFRHILQLKPDIIKLHMSLVRNIHADAARNALATALIQFGREQRCEVVAEGIETTAELAALKAMGVTRMQGYLLGRPGTLEAAAELCERVTARRAPSAPRRGATLSRLAPS
ncbi:MAG TPA: EAL domain-containing protein [Burkholderiales bacterium]|nr:EAL domain-containing protein [Burkholderiales bacterium]